MIETATSSIESRAPEELNSHSLNDEVYGDRDDFNEAFLDSIREQGVLEPIVVDSEDTIISGHRRVAAAREIGLDRVPVRVKEFDSELAKREALIHHNRHRDKTFSQKMREAEVLEEVKRERARERQGTRTDTSSSTEQEVDGGLVRDEVAEAVDFGSGSTYHRAQVVWEAAQSGDTIAQHEVNRLDRGEQSVHGAYQQVKERLGDDDDRSADEMATSDSESDANPDADNEVLDPEDLVLSAHVGTNDEVFPKVLDLHVAEGATVADVTYGNGTFWKRVQSGKYDLYATDIDPTKSPDSTEGVDCRDLPYEDGELDCVVLDPPYAEGFYDGDRVGGESTYWIKERYAGAADGELTYHEAVLHLYCEAGREVERVLRTEGKLIVKIQDEVSRNEQRLTHVEVTNYYQGELAFTAKDLFVVVRPDTPVGSNIKRQRRARKNHSYFLVFEKRAEA